MIIRPLANSFDRCYNYISIMRFGLPDVFEIPQSGLIRYRRYLVINEGLMQRSLTEKGV